MQAMIDHTAAVVIGATILMIVLALSTRSQDSSIEATQIDLAKTELRSLVDVVEQDFNNMGSGIGRPNHTAAERVVTFRGTQSIGGYTYQQVTFSALPDDASATSTSVTYRWRQNGTATLPDGATTVNLTEVQRESGGQIATFSNATSFGIVLRYDNLNPVNAFANVDSLALVRYLDVDIGMVPPVGTEALIQQTRWTKRFRPINLEPLNRRIIASPP